MKSIRVQPYNFTFRVYKKASTKKLATGLGVSFEEVLNDLGEFDPDEYPAFVYTKGNRAALCLGPDFTISHLAHESVHLVLDAMKAAGAYVDLENQEPFAYSVERTCKKIFKSLGIANEI